MATSKNVIDALDGIAHSIAKSSCGDSLPPCQTVDYPQLAIGPVEKVISFNNDETIQLKLNDDGKPYFSSHGFLTDLSHEKLPGSSVRTTFPVDSAQFPGTEQWPPKQPKPKYDPDGKLGGLTPPSLADFEEIAKTTGNGYSIQAYWLNKDDYFLTVGPSVPKIVRLKDGGAQFWVGSIGVITQGTGRFKGARGVCTYVGSGYFKNWPSDIEQQFAILQKPFQANIGAFVKYVPGKKRKKKTSNQ